MGRGRGGPWPFPFELKTLPLFPPLLPLPYRPREIKYKKHTSPEDGAGFAGPQSEPV